MNPRRTVILAILDGWGIGKADFTNPIHLVNPKNIDFIKHNFPTGSLQASGISVGLPWNEEGNSEVGHLNMGVGTVVYQSYPRITLAIRDNSFFSSPALVEAFAHATRNNSHLNLIGLLSEANVHASLEHLQAIFQYAERTNFPAANINLHLITDGYDSDPRSLARLLDRLPHKEQLASISGRYYAMDRDNHWDRIQQAYSAMTGSIGIFPDPVAWAGQFYQKNLSDEFITPVMIGTQPRPIADNDSVIFFNFREERMKQLVRAFVDPSFDKFPVKHLQNVAYCSLTEYDPSFRIPVISPSQTISEPLSKILADNGKVQWRTAETEKYAHITYFFNGMQEAPFPGEYRVLIPSRPEFRYEEHPEMRAEEITARLLEAVDERAYDFILVNYANADIIAHTGNRDACLKAVQIIDDAVGKLTQAALATDSILLITSDHGNMERIMNPLTGEVETKHDASPVPIYLVAKEYQRPRDDGEIKSGERSPIGVLADIAPTILDLLHIPKPATMTGQSLVDLLTEE